MLISNHIQAKRENQKQKQYDQKKLSERTQLSLLLASAKLSYACAMAVKHGKPNGEIEEGVEQYKLAMENFKQFERELVVDKTYEK